MRAIDADFCKELGATCIAARNEKGDLVPIASLDSIPTIQIESESKIGHWGWVKYDDYPILGNWICSKCKSVAVECVRKDNRGGIPLYKYCPQCGARMQEVEDEVHLDIDADSV